MMRCLQIPLYRFLLGIAVLSGASVSGHAEGERKPVPEYVMKAAYLYNFAQLTNWPAESGMANGTFNLCIFGQDEFGPALDTLTGKMVNSRPIRLIRAVDVAQARKCHLVFVGATDGDRGDRLFGALQSASILTVTDSGEPKGGGAMLQILADNQHLSFEVNLEAAERAQLTFSSKLLRLAKRVVGG